MIIISLHNNPNESNNQINVFISVYRANRYKSRNLEILRKLLGWMLPYSCLCVSVIFCFNLSFLLLSIHLWLSIFLTTLTIKFYFIMVFACFLDSLNPDHIRSSVRMEAGFRITCLSQGMLTTWPFDPRTAGTVCSSLVPYRVNGTCWLTSTDNRKRILFNR